MRNQPYWQHMALGSNIAYDQLPVLTEEPGYDQEVNRLPKETGDEEEDVIIQLPADYAGGNEEKVQASSSYAYSGVVRDAVSESPVPSATIELYRNGTRVAAMAANSAGYFYLSTSEPATDITISSVGYKTYNWPASEVQDVFDLERDEKDIDPVVLPPTKAPGDSNIFLWLLIAAAAYAATRK